jgi:hypothetical protein
MILNKCEIADALIERFVKTSRLGVISPSVYADGPRWGLGMLRGGA